MDSGELKVAAGPIDDWRSERLFDRDDREIFLAPLEEMGTETEPCASDIYSQYNEPRDGGIACR